MRRSAAAVLICAAVAACERAEAPAHLQVVDGDPGAGRAVVAARGCTACHRIPGIGSPQGAVGPGLDGFGSRAYLAGRFPNRPATLTAWLKDPPAMDPATAMPSLGLTDAQARHVAAYLYTLR